MTVPADLTTGDPFALGYFDGLATAPAGKGRVVFGKAFAEDGAGDPPVLLVHGAFHGAWCYAPWMRELDRLRWPSAAVELRGHGAVAPDADFPGDGAEAMAGDIVDAIAAMPAPPILVGHSLGALLVGIAASRATVAGLVILTPSPPGQLPGAKTLPAVPEGVVVAPPSPDAVLPKFFPRWRLQDIGPLHARLSPESPVLLNDRFLLRVDVAREAIDAPALCIEAGLDDADLHPQGQDAAVAAFYGADYVYLPEASHCLMVDPDWPVGLSAILDWWRDNPLLTESC